MSRPSRPPLLRLCSPRRALLTIACVISPWFLLAELCAAPHPQVQLHRAIEGNNIRALKRAIQAGANPSINDLNGVSPLMKAAQGVNIQAVRVLMPHVAKSGAINAKDRNGNTALDYLVDNKKLRHSRHGVAVLQALLANGAQMGRRAETPGALSDAIGCPKNFSGDPFCRRFGLAFEMSRRSPGARLPGQ